MTPFAYRGGLLAFLMLCAVSAQAADVDPLDWPYWRGPEMNGASRETGLVQSWSPKGENLLWMREDLGTHSTPVVMNGKMYVLTRNRPQTQEEGEKVVCVNAATGETIWENEFNVFLSEVPDIRVAWSNVTGDPETGNIYALGVCDLFQCIDGETGKTIWEHSLSEEYGLLNTYGGRTAVPLIFEDLVIINGVVIGWGEMSKPAHRFIAFNKRTGEPVWFESTRLFPEDTTYSSAAVANIGGQAQYVIGGGDGSMYSFQPRTGKKIWQYDVSPRGINTSPLIVGDTIYCGHSEENSDAINTMGAFFAIDGKQSGNVTKTNVGWKSKALMVGKSSPIMVNDRIIAIDDSANLFIVDPATGKVTGKKKLGASMRSSPVYGDGKIYTCTLDGRWYILELQQDGKGVKVLHQLRLNKHESDGSPIISHGRIYLPTSLALFCIGDKSQTPAADPAPTPAEEAPVADDQKPALVQIVPVEALIKPGTTQQLTARLFNAKGQFLRDAEPNEVQYEIAGAGTIEGGVYHADAQSAPNAAVITAKFADLTGGSRIRVISDLPWKEDFSSGEVPITWVGMRARNIVLDYDLLKELEAKNPLAGKLYIYLQTGFTNSGRPALKYDNTTPQQTWTELRRYLGVIEQTTNLDQAKSTLDLSLQLLVDEKVLAKWAWGDDGKGGVQLSVQKGPRGIDGNAVMAKITTIPKGSKSQGWMGPVDLHDYTIQADVIAANRNNKLPDIGLTAQRYSLNLGGASQELRIHTWPPQPLRTNKVVPFAWKADVWYTMKFQATAEGDHATLRAKVWPRDEQEPAEWTLEVVDPAPNLIGSPGMSGNARDAEIYIDNVQVTAN